VFTDRGGETMNGKAQKPRTAILRIASLTVDPDRLERMWAMTPQERQQAAQRGQLSLGEMLKWASRHPGEVELIDGEFWFITALSADTDVGDD
jgi:hypothetical protein